MFLSWLICTLKASNAKYAIFLLRCSSTHEQAVLGEPRTTSRLVHCSLRLCARKAAPKKAVPKTFVSRPIKNNFPSHPILWLVDSGPFWERPFWDDTVHFTVAIDFPASPIRHFQALIHWYYPQRNSPPPREFVVYEEPRASIILL